MIAYEGDMLASSVPQCPRAVRPVSAFAADRGCACVCRRESIACVPVIVSSGSSLIPLSLLKIEKQRLTSKETLGGERYRYSLVSLVASCSASSDRVLSLVCKGGFERHFHLFLGECNISALS